MGASGQSFSGGFLGGLANVMAANRQRDLQTQERQQQHALAASKFLLDTGQVQDVADLQPLLGLAFPEIMGEGAKKGGKGKAGQPDPQAAITNILGQAIGHPLLGPPATQPDAQPPAAGLSGLPGGTSVDGATAPLPSRPIAIPPAVSPRRTLFGIPVMTPEEGATRAANVQAIGTEAGLNTKIGLARRLYPTLKAADPNATFQDALIASGVPVQRLGTPDFTPVKGTVNGVATEGIMDHRRGLIVDPITREPIPGFMQTSGTATAGLGRLGTAEEEAAMRLYGKHAGDESLTQTQREAIHAEVLKAAGDTSGARATATGKARNAAALDKPIGPTAGTQYNVPPTTKLSELADKVGMTEVEKNKVSALADMDGSIGEIEGLIKSVFPKVDPGILGAVRTKLALGVKAAGADEDYGKLETAIDLAGINLARLAGETGGRVPVQIIAEMKAALANIKPSLFHGSSQDAALAKLEIIKSSLARIKQDLPTTAATSKTSKTGTTPSVPLPKGFEMRDGRLIQTAP